MTGDTFPRAFTDRMQKMLRNESEAFFASYERPAYKALRLNPLKIDDARSFCEELPVGGSVPWEELGHYYEEDAFAAGKHPYHEAGVYYIQEPSAMAPAAYLDVREGERILDLCAAPGGKSTQIAGLMGGSGLLVANEINPSRAKILSENIERFGVINAIVTNETPDRLAARFPGYFDRILVDAPCSGEGMFRKNQEAVNEWSPDNVAMCGVRQDEILAQADLMLRPGGRLVYSTCTFAVEEDEGTIGRFLQKHPYYRVVQVPLYKGMENGGRSDCLAFLGIEPAEGLSETIRLWPHKVKGEGHFVAVLIKGEETDGKAAERAAGRLQSSLFEQEIRPFLDFQKKHLKTGYTRENSVFLRFGDSLYRLMPEAPCLDGLKVLRPGLHLGTFLKNRFEPAHALAHAIRMTDAVNIVSYPPQSRKIREFLNGQTCRIGGENDAENGVIRISDKDAPWTLFGVGAYPLGWCKHTSGVLKNHYPKGLRIPI